MTVHRLERQQWIERPIAPVFEFFSRAENLGRITPPWMHFRLHTPTPIEMRTGTRIDYTIRLAGLPLAWRTRIAAWEPGVRFVDLQERGPYRLWEHTHEFTARAGGVLMTDRVRYALPLGRLGDAVHAVAIRTLLNAIFDYRFDRIRALHPDQSNGATGKTGREAA